MEIKSLWSDKMGKAELAERMRQVEAVAFDLDGTVLTSGKEIAARTLVAFGRALDAGVRPIPSSGRVLSILPHSLFGIPGMHYAVCAAGTSVVELGSHRRNSVSLHESGMDAQKAARIVEMIQERFGDDISFDVTCGLYVFTTEHMIDILSTFEDFPASIEFIRSTREVVDDMVATTRALTGPVSRINIYYRTPALRSELMGWLRENVACELGNSLGRNIEINELGASKWNGIKWLCAHIGASPERVLAIGDGGNDVDMIRHAWLGVAMKNADPCAIQAADAITLATNDEHGVAQVIEEIVALKRGLR